MLSTLRERLRSDLRSGMDDEVEGELKAFGSRGLGSCEGVGVAGVTEIRETVATGGEMGASGRPVSALAAGATMGIAESNEISLWSING